MARFMEPSAEQLDAYQQWVASRPECVRAVAERLDPWSVYRLKTTGSRCTVLSFGEAKDGTVTLTVSITAQFNLTLFDRNVFGIDPDDLEPCELPSDDEPLGALLSAEAVDENIDSLRKLAAVSKPVVH